MFDHISAMSGLKLDQIKAYFEKPKSLKRLYVWMDCGPHYRSYEHMACWAKTWFVNLGCEIILQFFIQKHGKGLVDGLFGRVRAWIRDYLMTTKKRIIEVDDLMAVLRGGAQTANERDQGGARHMVERFEPEAKPAAVW